MKGIRRVLSDGISTRYQRSLYDRIETKRARCVNLGGTTVKYSRPLQVTL